MTATIPETHTTAQINTGIPGSVVGAGLRTIIEGLHHPEGVCWSPMEQVLYAGGESGELYRFGLAGEPLQTVVVVPGGVMRGLALDGAGAVYVCDVGNGCVQKITPDGRVRQHGASIGYPNYPVFDGHGCLWVSDSGEWGTATGGIVRIHPDGVTERVVEGLHFANGLALRDDWLYVVESTWPRVVRVPVAGGVPETVITLDRVVPDGLAFDQEGGLWISCWQPNRVYRLSPEGHVDVMVDDWAGVYAPTPTNIAFAGLQMDVLVLASLGTDVVTACDPGVRGASLHRPLGVGSR